MSTKAPLKPIMDFFFADASVSEARPEIQALTAQDREQLSVGISDGTLTY